MYKALTFLASEVRRTLSLTLPLRICAGSRDLPVQVERVIAYVYGRRLLAYRTQLLRQTCKVLTYKRDGAQRRAVASCGVVPCSHTRIRPDLHVATEILIKRLWTTVTLNAVDINADASGSSCLYSVLHALLCTLQPSRTRVRRVYMFARP